MAAGAKKAEKPENTAFVPLVKWIYNGVLLRLYCRFDSYRERSILSGNERKIIAVFFIVFLLTANQKMSISANRNEKL